MKVLSVLTNDLESNVTLLQQVRNLNQYAMTLTICHEGQSIINQVHQRLGVIIGSLTSLTDDLRRYKPGPEESQQPGPEPVPSDHVDGIVYHFLSPSERADLVQLEHSFSELTIARDLVYKFKVRLIELAARRSDAGDYRGQGND